VYRSFSLGLLLGAGLLGGCQTYRDDLHRAQRYYEDNQYAQALSLFRALERDTDSLSVHEQARYAYFRGMTDYRLARVEGGSDERFDRHARYWLGIASAIEKEHPGGLQEHEKKRLDETLGELNAKAYGTSSRFETSGSTAEETTLPAGAGLGTDAATPAGGPEVAPPGAAPAPGTPPGANPCAGSADCPSDSICQDGACVKL
jgi:hypothetical protein